MRSILSAMAIAALSIHAASAADLSSSWARATAAAKNEVSAVRSLAHAPVKAAPRSVTRGAGSTTTYVNDSVAGVELDNIGVRSVRAWNSTTSLQVISATWTVPNAEMTIGICNSGQEKAGELIALDVADYAYPVLAGGLFMGADCEGSTVSQNFTPFFQVYNTVYTINMTVNAGDVLIAWVYYSGPTAGSIYIVDVNTGDFYQTTIQLPAGVTAIGDSAAWWIAAQTQTDNGQGGTSIEPLANYVASFMTDAYVADGASPVHSYGAGSAGALNSTLWLDGTTSLVTIAGPSTIYFNTAGCELNINTCNGLN
jgi:Peptidase A4 family